MFAETILCAQLQNSKAFKRSYTRAHIHTHIHTADTHTHMTFTLNVFEKEVGVRARNQDKNLLLQKSEG